MYEKDFEFLSELKVEADDLNVASIETGIFKCRYLAQIKIFYDFKFKKEPACVNVYFHVDPLVNSTKLFPILPNNWQGSFEPVIKLLMDIE